MKTRILIKIGKISSIKPKINPIKNKINLIKTEIKKIAR